MTFNSNTNICPSRGTLTIGWGDHGMARGETILKTRGLAGCVGLGLYDAATHTGYLGHLLAGGQSAEILTAIRTAVHQTTPGPDRLHAWIRGGAPVVGEDVCPADVASRQKVMQFIASLGIQAESVDTRWSTAPDQVVDMALHCKTGTIETTTHDPSALPLSLYVRTSYSSG